MFKHPLSAVALTVTAWFAAAANLHAQPVDQEPVSLSQAQISEDLMVLEDALKTLHPALNRYGKADAFWREFAAFKGRFEGPTPLEDYYLDLARLVAKIECGHTYLNYYNLSAGIRGGLIESRKTVPFHFRLIGERMVVTESATPALERGDEILSINDVSVRELLDTLVPLVKGDGGRRGPKLYDLQLTGAGRFEPFDIFFPLVVTGSTETLTLNVSRVEGSQSAVTVQGLTRKDRITALTEQGIALARAPEDSWAYSLSDDGIAYFKAGTFAVWSMEMDWKAFIKDAFAEMRSNRAHSLILDLRGNGGGLPVVAEHLLTEIADQPFARPPLEQRVAMQSVPERLRGALGTWDKSFYEWADRTTPTKDGQFLVTAEAPQSVPVNSEAFQGRVYVLIDRANSSATFTMAQVLRASGRATLIGEETGGNQRGITGGAILFLTLPGSGIEVDMPLIAYMPLAENENAGVVPDMQVSETIEDIRLSRDAVLDYTYSLVRSPRH